MLPFARMVEYGNTIVVKNIVDMQVSRSHSLVLESTGNLYGRGTNTNNILNNTGLSTTANFVLVDTGVTVMHCLYNITLYVKNGVLYRIGGSPVWDTGGAVTSPTAITLPFPASNIKKIQGVGNSSLMLLLNDGTIYFRGSGTNGRFGNASTGTINTWTLSSMNNVKDMFHTYTGVEGSSAFSIVLKNDGTVWGCGSVALNATVNCFRFGTYLSTTSWFQRTVSSNITAISSGSAGSFMALDSTGNLYADGNTNAEFTGTLAAPLYANTLMASNVTLFGVNYESSYYVQQSTPNVLNLGGRNLNYTSSFTSVGSYVERFNYTLPYSVSKIFTPSIDSTTSLQYILLNNSNNIVQGGNSTAYQLGVNTGKINMQLSVITLP